MYVLTHFAESKQISKEVSQVVQFGKVSCGSAMRTHDRYDAQNSYEHARDVMGGNARVGNDDIDSNGRRFQETPPNIAATMRNLIKSQEEKHQLNAGMILRNHTYLKEYKCWRILPILKMATIK